ncbi:MAG: 5'-nucleotidase [Capsulimonadales bacterium]|nr:5'-nucleotidase [Capsulimonadales bacterium]
MERQQTTNKRRNFRSGAGILIGSLLLTGLGATVLPVGSAIAAQATISTANVRTAETEAGNLLADAVRSAAGAEIGFFPAAAFKPGVSVARPVTAAQAATLVDPPTDVIVVLNLRGDQVLAALERSVSFAPQPSAGFLQVSGLRFSFDVRKESQKRVSNVTVNDRPLESGRVYKVATTRPLGNGQQGYGRVWDRASIASDTGKSLEAALADFARGGTLSPSLDRRITQTP